jgi:hypothetical protein
LINEGLACFALSYEESIKQLLAKPSILNVALVDHAASESHNRKPRKHLKSQSETNRIRRKTQLEANLEENRNAKSPEKRPQERKIKEKTNHKFGNSTTLQTSLSPILQLLSSP